MIEIGACLWQARHGIANGLGQRRFARDFIQALFEPDFQIIKDGFGMFPAQAHAFGWGQKARLFFHGIKLADPFNGLPRRGRACRIVQFHKFPAHMHQTGHFLATSRAIAVIITRTGIRMGKALIEFKMPGRMLRAPTG